MFKTLKNSLQFTKAFYNVGMKRHVRFYNTGYYLCSLKVGKNGGLQDPVCDECNRQAHKLLWNLPLTNFLKRLLDKKQTSL